MDGGFQLCSLLLVDTGLGHIATCPVTMLFTSVKTHTDYLHSTSLRNLLTEAGPPRLRAVSGYQNSLHCAVVPDFPCLYQDKTLTNTKTWVVFLPWTHGWRVATNGGLKFLCLLS